MGHPKGSEWTTHESDHEHRKNDHDRRAAEQRCSCASGWVCPFVLLSSRAPIGLVAINGVPMATNQGFKSLVPHQDRADAGFLAHWMAARTSQLQALGTGATFKEISKSVVERIALPLPPLDEQRRIARILDAAGALRAKRRAAIAQLDKLIGSIFLEMFGDPVTNPRGWPNPTLGGLLTFQQYGPRFHNASYSADGIRIIRITDLNDTGHLEFAQMPRLAVTPEVRTKYALRPGDLIFARTGATVGKVALISPNDPECIAGAYFITMRFDVALEPRYATAVLTSPSVRTIIATRSRQSAQQNFSGPALRRLPMPLPSRDRQRRFVSYTIAVEQLRAAYRASLAALEAQSGSLQYRAFGGTQ